MSQLQCHLLHDRIQVDRISSVISKLFPTLKGVVAPVSETVVRALLSVIGVVPTFSIS